MTIDEKSKKLLWVVLLAAFLSLAFTFVKTVILGDFDIVESEQIEEAEQLEETSEDVSGASGTIETGAPIDENFEDVPQEVLGESIELI